VRGASLTRLTILEHRRPPARCRCSTIRARSARRYLGRHRPQSRDIKRCFQASCDRGAVAQRAGCQSFDRSERPSSDAPNGCHRRTTLSQCFQPKDEPAGHIGGWGACVQSTWEEISGARCPQARQPGFNGAPRLLRDLELDWPTCLLLDDCSMPNIGSRANVV
jgi:hypothetical protein